MSQNKNMAVSEFRLRLNDVIGKSYIFLRPDNMEQYLRPKRALKQYQCALDKESIESGEYYYACSENPIRLNPSGKSHVCIHHAEREGSEIAPDGYIVMRIPTYEEVAGSPVVKNAVRHQRRMLEKEAARLLKSAKKLS